MKLTKQYGYRISQGTGKTWSNLLILTVGALKKFNKSCDTAVKKHEE